MTNKSNSYRHFRATGMPAWCSGRHRVLQIPAPRMTTNTHNTTLIFTPSVWMGAIHLFSMHYLFITYSLVSVTHISISKSPRFFLSFIHSCPIFQASIICRHIEMHQFLAKRKLCCQNSNLKSTMDGCHQAIKMEHNLNHMRLQKLKYKHCFYLEGIGQKNSPGSGQIILMATAFAHHVRD